MAAEIKMSFAGTTGFPPHTKMTSPCLWAWNAWPCMTPCTSAAPTTLNELSCPPVGRKIMGVGTPAIKKTWSPDCISSGPVPM